MRKNAIISLLISLLSVGTPLCLHGAESAPEPPMQPVAQVRPFHYGSHRYPKWSQMTPELLRLELAQTYAELDTAVAAIAEVAIQEADWENTCRALDSALRQPAYLTGLVHMLGGICDSEEWRAALADASAVQAEISALAFQNEKLWALFSGLSEQEWVKNLPPAQRSSLEHIRFLFRWYGAGLSAEKKARLCEIRQEFAPLSIRYEQNLKDTVAQAELAVPVGTGTLKGVRSYLLRAAKQNARERGQKGYLFTMLDGSLITLAEVCETESVRKAAWEALNRVGNTPEHDNQALLLKAAALRHEWAQLLGFNTYADLATQRNMLSSGEKAMSFVDGMMRLLKPAFDAECAEMLRLYNEAQGKQVTAIPPWDVDYAVALFKDARSSDMQFNINSYLEIENVMAGAFRLFAELYGVEFRELKTQSVAVGEPAADGAVEVWHPGVKCFEVYDTATGKLLGAFYADLYRRSNKKAGSWILPLRVAETPMPRLAVMSLFVDEDNDTFSLSEVESLFHELGHIVHFMVSNDESSFTSSQSVASDYVEVPSTLAAFWAYEPEILADFTHHNKVGTPYPKDDLERYCRECTKVSALEKMKYLCIARLDLELHHHYEQLSNGQDVNAALQVVMAEWRLPTTHGSEADLCQVPHLMYSRYAAGYYSYIWAEVLAADIFEYFKREGLKNKQAGATYRRMMLEPGAVEPAAELYRRFMGRDPQPDAFLRRHGIPISNNK
ncbi:MAG: hypothetical protein IKV92_09765 [Akkermansia sp.]|nr:hypothetical protein [Akkermansia sp.]